MVFLLFLRDIDRDDTRGIFDWFGPVIILALDHIHGVLLKSINTSQGFSAISSFYNVIIQDVQTVTMLDIFGETSRKSRQGP